MTRILHDSNGAYDMAHVVAVIPVIDRSKTDDPDTTHARIHLHGGQAFSLALPYDYVLETWVSVKSSESHPADIPLSPESQQ